MGSNSLCISGALLSYNGSPTVGVKVWPSRSDRVKGAALLPSVKIGGPRMTCMEGGGRLPGAKVRSSEEKTKLGLQSSL